MASGGYVTTAHVRSGFSSVFALVFDEPWKKEALGEGEERLGVGVGGGWVDGEEWRGEGEEGEGLPSLSDSSTPDNVACVEVVVVVVVVMVEKAEEEASGGE